ncbi:MAG: tripartite tricarboxylate transporter permease [Spirochaetaceae bacterium]|nr:tripartite tricarboxylate transporter permease [Spirochaetaceae bacterium]
MIAEALSLLFTPLNMLIITLGVGSGIIVGALPGLTATMAIALLVPFTFSMNSVHSLVLLGGIYCGAIYGGSFSAILINTPGTPSAIATTFDGYAMSQKGESYGAIITATIASVIGGIIGVLFLLFLSPPLSRAALKFGPPEFFWLTVFGLTIIATLASRSVLKGLIGGAFGLLLSVIGIAPIEGSVRYAFGSVSLQSGIALIPAMIGLFCIPEIIGMVAKKDTHYNVIPYKREKKLVRRIFFRLLKKPLLLFRSSVIGTIVGIIPGAGGNIAGMVAYNEAVRASKFPERFGTGIIDGVAASESSNNAEVSGSLIPMLTLGIPGAPPAAILLGALLIQGLRPGPDLFTTNGEVTYAFIFSLILANILILPLGLLMGKGMTKVITGIPVTILAPFVFLLSVIGSFAINNNMADVYVMLVFGIIGFIGRKAGFSAGPIVLGLILGSICEQGLVQSILMGRAKGSMAGMFFARPISIILIVMTLISALWPMLIKARNLWSAIYEKNR